MRKENSIYQVWLKGVEGYTIALVINGRFHEMHKGNVNETPIDEDQIEKYEYLGENK